MTSKMPPQGSGVAEFAALVLGSVSRTRAVPQPGFVMQLKWQLLLLLLLLKRKILMALCCTTTVELEKLAELPPQSNFLGFCEVTSSTGDKWSAWGSRSQGAFLRLANASIATWLYAGAVLRCSSGSR
jgi:hypothetical protein